MKKSLITYLGNPILRSKARSVKKEEFQSVEFISLIKDLKKTIKTKEGLGLAAPQIGRTLRVFAVYIHSIKNRPKLKQGEIQYCVNPKVIHASKEKETNFEGCLSIPDIYGLVERALKLKVSFFTSKGKQVIKNIEGLEARVFQHELDHLNGILFIDRMKDMRSLTMGTELVKYTRE